jgi:uncharacterized protein YndB with AHSA1/START domain
MDQNYTTTFTVDQTPEQVFATINNVRGWWTGEIEGSTDQLGAEFTYRYADIHYSKQKITELVPGKKIVWLVTDAHLNFTEDKSEWKGTEITFDLAQKGDQTEIRFTHLGLVPAVECFDQCSTAWGYYINGSLRNFITTANGQPNQPVDQKESEMDQNYTTTFTVDQTPEQVFAAINNVRGWWSEEIEGNTDQLGSEFKYHFADVHRCQMKITEFVPNQKVVWRVLDNYFDFTEDKTEWVNTEISFEIAQKDDQTEVHFMHLGLVPEYECFDLCTDAWGVYINGSLRSLITTGQGRPNANQRASTEAEQVLLDFRAGNKTDK